jgi:amidase
MPANSSLDCVGPMAAEMASLIAGMRAIDPGFGPLPGLESLRIGVLDVPSSEFVRQAVDDTLAAAGLPLTRLRLDKFKDAYDAGMVIINVETWAACGELVKTGLVGQDVMQRLLAAARWTADDVARAEAVRRNFTAEVDAALEKVSILALPTLPDAPPRLADAADTSKLLSVSSLVRPFNLSGHPAISIPLKSRGDFPISLQLVAAKGADELLCAVAAHISRL